MANKGDFAEINDWIKALYSNQKKEAKEAQKLVDDHFFDAESIRQKPEYIECPKDRLQWISKERDRAVFILFKSGCMPVESIARVLKTDHKTIHRIVSRCLSQAA